MDVEMMMRGLIILCFGTSAVILAYAHLKQPYTPHLIGIIIWCLHIIVFTFVAALCCVGIFYIDPHYLNLWSNTVRLHGGICLLSTALYYLLFRKKELLL
jgi:hypothetical protein